MELKHFSVYDFNQTNEKSKEYGSTFRGCRNQRKEAARSFIESVKMYSTTVDTLPDEYIIVFTESVNLGTKRWSDVYTDWNTRTITKETPVRETEKSYIIEHTFNGKTYKTIINKSKILCFVF